MKVPKKWNTNKQSFYYVTVELFIVFAFLARHIGKTTVIQNRQLC